MFNDLIFKKIDSKNYELVEDLIFKNNKYEIVVKKFFQTDGASIPKILQNIFGPFSGNYTKAAVIHDALYQSNSLNRLTNDLLFLEMMKELKTNFLTRYSMYYAVKLFGFLSYKSYSLEHILKIKKYIIIKIDGVKIWKI